MANTRPFGTARAIEIGIDNGKYSQALDDIYYTVRDNVSLHKSFDFSNVGIPSVGNRGNRALRQFHQTRIFIQDFSGMLHHGQQNTSGSTYLLSANLPEKINYNIGSKWEQPLNFGTGVQNLIMQMMGDSFAKIGNTNGAAQKFTGKAMSQSDFASGVNRLTTMQVWGGSNPLSLKLDIPVIDDGYEDRANQTGVNTNFAEALEFLGSLALPRKGQSRLGFYTPPPSPLGGKITFGKNLSLNLGSTHARILVQLGGILLIDNCIIKGITVEYPNTKTMIRHNYSGLQVGMSGDDYLLPLLARIQIDLTTVEALTADTYSNMLWLKQQRGEGYMADDLSKTWYGKGINALAGGISTVAGYAVDGISAATGFVSDVFSDSKKEA